VPLAELARALPALLVVGVLPGLVLATLVVPGWRWWMRLAAAPGLSAGMAGVIGLVLHDLHLPFMAPTVLPLEAALVVAAAWRHRRRTHAGGAPTGRGRAARRDRWVLIAAAAAGAVSSAMVAAGFHSLPVPLITDAPVHGIVANAIARTHDTLPVNPDPAQASAWVRPRSGFEAVAALASEIGGPGPTADMLPFVTLAVALLPLGLAALTLEATGSPAMAALAPLLGVGWAFPAVPIFFGEYPYIIDATLVAPAIIVVLRMLRRSEVTANLLMLAVVMASIWVVHGLEAITALAVGGPLVAAGVPGRDRRRALSRLALAGAAAGAGALLVILLTRLPAVPSPTTSPLAGPVASETSAFAAGVGRLGLVDALTAFVQFAFPTVLAAALFTAGVAACLVQRRDRWAVVAHVLLLACFLDMLVTGRLGRLWDLLYPWSGEDRLPAIQYWVVPIVMAAGTLWLVGPVEALLRTWLARLRHRSGPRASRLRLRAGVLAAAAGALLMVVDMGHDADLYRRSVQDLGVAGPTDIAVMQRMARRLPAGAVILVDGGDDSGQWVEAITGDRLLLTNGFLKDHPADVRIVALQNACADPGGAAAVLGGVDAVFIGSRTIPEPRHPWSLRCIAAIPDLTPLIEMASPSGTAAAFRVDHGAGAEVTAPGRRE
jgi:hypothetical protein